MNKNLTAQRKNGGVFTGKFIFLTALFFAAFTGVIKTPAQSAATSNDGLAPNSTNLDSVKKSESILSKVRNGELPLSRLYEFLKPSAEKAIVLPELDKNEMRQPAGEKRLRIGTVRKLDEPVDNAADGTAFKLNEGNVRLFEIRAEKAVRLRVHFERMNLSEGAKIFVYSAENPDDVYVYERNGQGENGKFWTPPVEGGRVIVEYFTPDMNIPESGKLPFQITEISHIFRDALNAEESCGEADPPSQNCHLNVPAAWTELAKSVGGLDFVSGVDEVFCTGTLLNTLANDFHPIFLTANHCINTAAEAQSLRVYWAYNSGDSPSGALPRSDGAILLSTGDSSDYTLVQILGALPVRANQVFWSGWEATFPPSGTEISTIHHPNGSYKRYSSGSVISGFCFVTPCQNFVPVRYSQGTTERGSSGSALWTGVGTAAKLVGKLTGGEFGCGIRDVFGSFAVTFPNISSFLQGGSDDNFDGGSGNDNRNAASVINAPTTFDNLIIKWQDDDWYRISVAAGSAITVRANFTHSRGDIDLELYRSGENAPVAVSNGASNTQTITFTNNSGSAQVFDIRVFLFDGARNTYSLTLEFQPGIVTRRAVFDFDGDGRSDISVYRPADGVWFLNQSQSGFAAAQFGISSDLIVPADYDGDGRTDIAVFRNGVWFLQRSSAGFAAVQFGQAGDIPVPADYTGDGRAELAVYRGGVWFVFNLVNNEFSAVQFGISTDKPVQADYDADGRADFAVYRDGVWFIQASQNGFSAIQFGIASDKPVTGDFDGDGRADQAVYRDGVWFLNQSQAGFAAVQFGISTDVPVAADYDGDGRTDIAVFRNGVWFILASSNGAFSGIQFGISNDKPIPAAFISQ